MRVSCTSFLRVLVVFEGVGREQLPRLVLVTFPALNPEELVSPLDWCGTLDGTLLDTERFHCQKVELERLLEDSATILPMNETTVWVLRSGRALSYGEAPGRLNI